MNSKEKVRGNDIQLPKGALVSVVTPSYNQARFIKHTIQSVRSQAYQNIEHIIIDGGSTDNTLAILREYERTYNMRWISEPDKGQTAAVNKGIGLARGGIIGWLNSDDCYFTQDVVSEAVKAFARNPAAHVVYGDWSTIDEHNRLISVYGSLPFVSQALLKRHNYLSQPSMFITAHVAQRERLDERLHYVMDYEYWLRLLKQYNFIYLSKILAAFRIHGRSKSVSDREKMSQETRFVSQQWGGRLGSIGLIRYQRIKALRKAWRLYRHPYPFFAFAVELPPRSELIINQLLPKCIRRGLSLMKKNQTRTTS